MPLSLQEFAADKVRPACVVCALPPAVLQDVDENPQLPRPVVRQWLAGQHSVSVSRDQLARHMREHRT